MKKTYSGRELAKITGLHYKTVYNYVKRGLLPDRKGDVSEHYVFYEEDLEKLKEIIKIK